MAASRSRVDFDMGNLEGNLARLGARVPIVIAGIVERRSDIAEGYMKDGAPWTDRTGNARAGLRAIPEHSSNRSVITLMHSMPYGIWLEVRWAGRWGILVNTLREQGQGLMDDMQALMRRL